MYINFKYIIMLAFARLCWKLKAVLTQAHEAATVTGQLCYVVIMNEDSLCLDLKSSQLITGYHNISFSYLTDRSA